MVANGNIQNQYIYTAAADDAANPAHGRRVMIRSLEEWTAKNPTGKVHGPPENFFIPIFRMSISETEHYRSLDVGVIRGGALIIQSTTVENGRPHFHFEIRKDMKLEPVQYRGLEGDIKTGYRLAVKSIWRRIWEAVKCF